MMMLDCEGESEILRQRKKKLSETNKVNLTVR